MGTIAMFDSVTVSAIPRDAKAVAGYVNGRFHTWPFLVRLFPKAHRLSIAVSSSADAECLDVEPGDATNAVAAGWVRRQQNRGVQRPVLYTSLSNAQALLNTLARAGIGRGQIRLWTAHFTFHQHRCGPGCGFGLQTTADATQWTDKSRGRNLDESVCNDQFFGVTPVHPAVDKGKIARWRQRLRHAQALLRSGLLPAALRCQLAAYARQLRALIRKGSA